MFQRFDHDILPRGLLFRLQANRIVRTGNKLQTLIRKILINPCRFHFKLASVSTVFLGRADDYYGLQGCPHSKLTRIQKIKIKNDEFDIVSPDFHQHPIDPMSNKGYVD